MGTMRVASPRESDCVGVAIVEPPLMAFDAGDSSSPPRSLGLHDTPETRVESTAGGSWVRAMGGDVVSRSCDRGEILAALSRLGRSEDIFLIRIKRSNPFL
jgi:hypothetical protein